MTSCAVTAPVPGPTSRIWRPAVVDGSVLGAPLVAGSACWRAADETAERFGQGSAAGKDGAGGVVTLEELFKKDALLLEHRLVQRVTSRVGVGWFADYSEAWELR